MPKPAAAAAVVDTEVVVAEATWAASAGVTSAASAGVTSAVSAEVASEVLAEITWRACVAITLVVNDVISLTAAFTTTASVARITRHTTGRTPATTEA